MRTICTIFLNLLIFTSVYFSQTDRNLDREKSASNQDGKRIALVIGNGAYTAAPPLKNPPNDARDMAATLKALGFDVTSGINVNQRNFKRLIREFGQKLKAGGSGLFYYAGHGVQSKGHNYLIPVDADIASEAEVEDSGVDVALVLNFMDDAQNGLNIVILDACRNNPFARSFRSASNGLAQVDAPTGTLIAYATAPGAVASDGTDQNGLYTSELLKQMRIAGQSATDTFMLVRAEVMKQTANKQVPWEASSLVGAFYFGPQPKNSGATPSSGTSAEPRFDPSAFELSYWETIKSSSNAEDFKAYLEKYPNGQFTSLAKNRVASLDATAKPVEPKPVSAATDAIELAFWDAVKNSDRIDDFRAYVKKYPQGVFTELAGNRITGLESAAREKSEKTEAIKKSSLEGTVWRGSSPGRDKTYRLHFMPDGVASLVYLGYYNGRGSWRQTGSTIYMDFGMLGDKGKMEANLSGSTMTGSWNYGIYNFTLVKQDGESDEETTRNAKVFKGEFGVKSAFGNYFNPSTVFVYPTFIRIAADEKENNPKAGGIGGDEIVECSAFKKALVDGVFIREIKGQYGASRFKANTPDEAVKAFEAIQTVCKNK